jgi:hypothetical protein
MSPLPPIVHRLAVVALASIPVCWILVGIVAWNWLEREQPARATALRAIGPAALLLPAVASAEAADAPAAASLRTVAYAYSAAEDSGFSWAVLRPGDADDARVTVDLDDRTSPGLSRLRHESPVPVFWFRLDGDEFVVRDAAMVAEADAAQRPLGEIGRRMGEVGGEQGRVGGRQGRIGGRLGLLGARLAQMRTRLSLAGHADDPDTRRQLDAIEQQLDALRREQLPLGEQMRALGEQMARLGREMAAATDQARRQLRALAERAVREGKAERLHAEA